VKEPEVFADSLRFQLIQYQYEEPDQGTEEFSVMKTLYDGFMKNGDKEKFYGKFYATRYFQGLSHNSATLLATKVADSMLTYCKHLLPTSDEYSPSQTLLSDRDIWTAIYRWICIA